MSDPRLQALLDQLDMIWLILERPVVQRQLLAFALIVLLSWLIPAPLGIRLNKMLDRQIAGDRRRKEQGLPTSVWRWRTLRFARGVQQILFPLVGLLATRITAGYFSGRGWPVGLLQRLQIVFWLVFIYSLVGGIFYTAMDAAKAKYYEARFVRPFFIILVVISLSTGLAASFPFVEITLFSLLGTAISIRSLATAAVVLYLFLAVAWILRDLLRNVVQPRLAADPGTMNTITVVSNYAIIGIGVLAAISILGFDLSALAIIGGGLSVGIGFGLQELVANFISGILLLFEQTLRPGDIVEVSGQRGTVNHLYMRATVLRTIDNVQVFVPNKTLLTSTVATYTSTDRTVRRTLQIRTSYDADPQRVRDLLQNLTTSHGRVLATPAPAVFFTGFGESSLDFEIALWLGDSNFADQVLSDLRFMIYKEFKKNNIEIPYPQRDLNLRTSDLRLDSLTAPTGNSADDVPKPVAPEKPRLP